MIRQRDGIHAEYGCCKNQFPRTMIEAYGEKTELSISDDWKNPAI